VGEFKGMLQNRLIPPANNARGAGIGLPPALDVIRRTH